MTKCVHYLCANIFFALVLATFLGTFSARAEEADLRFHGFASQRLATSSGNNNYFGDTRGRLSADYTEIGTGVSWRPRTQWLLSAQAIYRRGGHSEKEVLEPDYFYAAYTPLEGGTGHVTLKLGKIKIPYGFYGDTRDTPMTRPGVLAPQSIYMDALRSFNQAAVGAHVEAEAILGNNAITLRLSQVKHDVESENTFWLALQDRTQFKGELYSRNNESMSSQLSIDHDGGKWRAALSRVEGLGHYRPGNGDLWSGGKINYAFSALSVQWNGEDVSLTSEYSRSDVHSQFTPGLDKRGIGESWYIQSQWRIAPGWEGVLRYDVYYANKADRDGVAYAADPLNGGRPPWSRFAKDWTVGVSYRPSRNWLLAGEVHHVHGTAWLPPADNLSNGQWVPGNASPDWNLFLLQATYQF